MIAHLERMGAGAVPSAPGEAAAASPLIPASVPVSTSQPAPAPAPATPTAAVTATIPRVADPPGAEATAAPRATRAGLDYASIDFSRWTPAQRIARGLVSGLVRAVADTRIEGAEHMPASGPVLIAANHLSMWDAPVLLRYAERRTVIFAAEELRRFPWMHWTLHKLWDAIYLRRGEGDTEAMEQAAAVLRAGGVIGLSPEGIRNPGGLTRGLTGVAHLAFRTGAPIVPMAVFGQERIPSRAPRLRRTRGGGADRGSDPCGRRADGAGDAGAHRPRHGPDRAPAAAFVSRRLRVGSGGGGGAMSDTRAGHAVVIGASMAGLLSARVLSDYFERVTLLERDEVRDEPVPRKGQPHARHLHSLLAQGLAVCERFFPTLRDDLCAGGAILGDMGADIRWHAYGGYRRQFPSGMTGVLMTRAFLEQCVRRRVMGLPNVTVRGGTAVEEPVATPDRRRIVGLRLKPNDGASAEVVEADFVVDAAGRGSAAPKWAEALGYARPQESAVTVNMGYSTRIFKRRPGDLEGAKLVLISPRFPGIRRSGYMFPVEGDRWVATLGGWGGEYPPSDDAGFLEFARGLAAPDVHELLQRVRAGLRHRPAPPALQPAPALREARRLARALPGAGRRHQQLQSGLRAGHDVGGHAGRRARRAARRKG